MHIKGKYGNGYHLELLLDLKKQNTPSSPDDLAWTVENVELRLIEALAAFSGLDPNSFHVMEKALFAEGRLKLVLGLESNKDDIAQVTRITEGGSRKPMKRLGKIFQWCTANEFGILEDYSLGQPTLEQVFLKFAKQQEQLDEREDVGATGQGGTQAAD